MNAGFLEAFQRTSAECFVFHDVDLIPEDDRNMYSCWDQPRHLSVGVDALNYTLPYKLLVGGVLNMHAHHLFKVNGFSNFFWGWGGEDDDMANRLTRLSIESKIFLLVFFRIRKSGLSLSRPTKQVALFTMIKHHKRKQIEWKVNGFLTN